MNKFFIGIAASILCFCTPVIAQDNELHLTKLNSYLNIGDLDVTGDKVSLKSYKVNIEN